MGCRVAAGACLALICSQAAYAQGRLAPHEMIPPLELEAFVDGMVHQTMAAQHIAGASVSVVQGGQVVFKKGYGFADLAASRRVDPDRTPFRIGSITKTFTWIALMNAIQAGRIGLDDPINSHLPDALRIPDTGFTESIRVRHLMTHSAGFEDRMFGHLFETDAAHVRPLAAYLREERPMRVREAGVLHSYSNYGVALAGAALEHVSGREWQQIVETEILRPLQMNDTSPREPYPARDDLPAPMPDDLMRRVSKGYRWTGLAHEPQPFEYIGHIAPAGVMSTSAGDMARYMVMLLNGGSLDDARVLGPEAMQAFYMPMTSFPARVGNWNAGFMSAQLPGGFESIGHDGGSLLFFSSMVLVPELRLGMFVTTNTEGGDSLSGPFANRIVEHFYGPSPDPPLPPASALSDSASAYNGYYLQTRRPYSGLQGFAMRLLARRVRISDGYLVTGLMGPPQRFVPGDGSGEFRSADADGALRAVQFRREGDVAIRIDTPLMAFERVTPLMQPPMLILPVALGILISLGTLARTRRRFDREVSRNVMERRAAGLQTLTAVAWLTSAVGFGLFAARTLADETTLLYDWPVWSILIFSTAALVASGLSAGMIVVMPALWRNASGGWTVPRKLRFTATALIFAACAGMLASWGALQPWNP
jgi:CubicO group peptidase (beta-lactamase class C family)